MGHRACSVSWLDHLDKAGRTGHHRALNSSATSNQDPRSATEGWHWGRLRLWDSLISPTLPWGWPYPGHEPSASVGCSLSDCFSRPKGK